MRKLLAAFVVLAVVACESVAEPEVATRDSPGTVPALNASQNTPAAVNQQLAALRRLTAHFHNFQGSQAAGYTILATGCRENPPIGAMGFHYLNLAYVDGTVTPLEPELVIYEPRKNGELRFVGVEYIIPYAILPETASPPVLFGREFLQNPGDQLWMMHVWVGRNNPDGLFATWNPNVSCQYAAP